MENIILTKKEINDDFVKNAKEYLSNKISTSITCAFEYKESSETHLKFAKYFQYFLQLSENETNF